jgi:GDP-L-fucose synthase
MDKSARILVTGAGGVVGKALMQELAQQGFTDVVAPTSSDVDMRDRSATEGYIKDVAPAVVYHLAAKVYGMKGNMDNKGLSYFENVLINTHVVEACRLAHVSKLVAMGSGAVYPYPPPDPDLREETIWAGLPHHSEDSYAIAKRALQAQLDAYEKQYGLRSVFAISGNLYGPHDRFDIDGGHVTPSLVRKFYEAKTQGGEVEVWGDGSAVRDFTYASDMARALITVMGQGQGAINVGSGYIHPIRDIVDALTEITGLAGRVRYVDGPGNGQAYRAYNLDKLRGLGFTPQVPLKEGLRLTYEWYAANSESARR